MHFDDEEVVDFFQNIFRETCQEALTPKILEQLDETISKDHLMCYVMETDDLDLWLDVFADFEDRLKKDSSLVELWFVDSESDFIYARFLLSVLSDQDLLVIRKGVAADDGDEVPILTMWNNGEEGWEVD